MWNMILFENKTNYVTWFFLIIYDIRIIFYNEEKFSPSVIYQFHIIGSALLSQRFTAFNFAEATVK